MASTSKQMTQKFGRTTATTTTVLNDNGCQMIPANGPFGNKTIGPRTVIVPADPLEWNEGTTYEYMTLVLAPSGNSYISKRDVPAGTPVTNTDYWIKSSDWNAQLADIQDIIKDMKEWSKSNPVYYGADPTGVSDSSAAINECIQANIGKTIEFTAGIYLLNNPINTPYETENRTSIKLNGAILIYNSTVQTNGVINVGSNETDADTVATGSTLYHYDTVIDGGTIVNNGSAAAGISISKHFMGLKITNCNIYSSGNGISVFDNGSNRSYPLDLLVDNVYIIKTGELSAGIGIDFGRNTDSTVNNTRIYGFKTMIKSFGTDTFTNIHTLGRGNNVDGTVSIEFSFSIFVNNLYNDNVQTVFHFTGLDGQSIEAVLEASNIFDYDYKVIQDRCFINMESSMIVTMIDKINIFGRAESPGDTYTFMRYSDTAKTEENFSGRYIQNVKRCSNVWTNYNGMYQVYDPIFATHLAGIYNTFDPPVNKKSTVARFIVNKNNSWPIFIVSPGNIVMCELFVSTENAASITPYTITGTNVFAPSVSFVEDISRGLACIELELTPTKGHTKIIVPNELIGLLQLNLKRTFNVPITEE